MRCRYQEGDRRCHRNGFGDPPLCRAHAIAMDYELDLDDPVGSLIDQADRFLSGQKDTLVHSFAQALGQILRPPSAPIPSATPGARAGSRSTPPPPKPPPPPAPAVKEDPRDVLGFSKDAKLTRALVKERQRALAALLHPDKGGSVKAMQRLNEAVKELVATLK